MSFLIFFPIVVCMYFAIPTKFRWVWLLCASYYFYMCWNPVYASLIAISTVITFISGLFLEKFKKLTDANKRKLYSKWCVGLSFGSNLAILVFFKYSNFLIDNISAILANFNITFNMTFDILLPVGISFYTFQALSYTMDVYRGDIYAEKNLFKYALFVSFFPQLVAGPIERSKNLLVQINKPQPFIYSNLKNGLQLMGWGLFQKIVIADRVAVIVNQIYNNHTQYSGSYLVLATVLFAVQIYCDFSGYSDIAIGAAQVMGFKLMDNFNQPYFATSIKEFWRRWHISLSTWFKDYLYIPLGGNRCSTARNYFNIFLTFLVSGLWHGASWTFIIWGALHGIYQIIGSITKPFKNRVTKAMHINQKSVWYKLLQCFITFGLVNIAWVFFRAQTAGQAFEIFNKMLFSLDVQSITNKEILAQVFPLQQWVITSFAITALWVVDFLRRKIKIREIIQKQIIVVRWFIYFVAINILLLFGFYGMGYSQSQFLYFQF